MSPLRLNGSISGYSEIEAPTNAGSETFTLHTAGGTLVTADGTQTLTNKTIQGGAITSGTSVASTSGTSIDFTGIPSWVKRITVMFNGMSTSGTSDYLIRLGTSSGITTSGYLSRCSYIFASSSYGVLTNTTGFLIGVGGSAAQSLTASITFSLLSSSANNWIECGVIYRDDAIQTFQVAGVTSLSGTLDRVRITTVNGTDTFDAGTINILYEG